MNTAEARLRQIADSLNKHANARRTCVAEGHHDTAQWHRDQTNRLLDEINDIRTRVTLANLEQDMT